jgi:hypothetical protein
VANFYTLSGGIVLTIAGVEDLAVSRKAQRLECTGFWMATGQVF